MERHLAFPQADRHSATPEPGVDCPFGGPAGVTPAPRQLTVRYRSRTLDNRLVRPEIGRVLIAIAIGIAFAIEDFHLNLPFR